MKTCKTCKFKPKQENNWDCSYPGRYYSTTTNAPSSLHWYNSAWYTSEGFGCDKHTKDAEKEN